MSAVVPFNFEGAPVRIITRDDCPWFVLADVCQVLGLANPRDAAARLDDDEKGVGIADTLGGAQQATIISEPGLYRLMVRSRKPAARRFDRWVRHEVLPSIRRTGGYSMSHPASSIDFNNPGQLLQLSAGLAHALQKTQATVATLQADVAVMAPKAVALDRIATADGSFCLTDAAKTLQVGRAALIQFMCNHRWIFRRAGGGALVGYQTKVQSGLLEHKLVPIELSDGSKKIVGQVRVTAAGIAKLAVILAAPGLHPVPGGTEIEC